MSPALTKAGKLAAFLSSGLQGALAGRAAQEQAIVASGGRRAGGVGTGFEAGYTLPWQRAQQLQQVQSGQLQQQLTQADIAQKRAQTGLTNVQAGLASQSTPITLPNGQQIFVPKNQAAGVLGNVYKGSAAAQTGAQSKIDVENLKIAVEQGEVARIVPTPDGKYEAFNKFGKSMGTMENSVVPSLMSRTSNTVQYETDSDGNIVALPKTTVTQKSMPGAKPTGSQPAQPSAPGNAVVPSGGRATGIQKTTPKMVMGSMADGSQVAGTPQELKAAGAQGVTQMEASDVSKVSVARQLTGPGGLYDLIDKDLAKFSPQELTALGARWNEFQTGTLGTGDPRYAALRTHTHLLGTALMQAHVGSRGGEHMMDEFENLADAGKMNGDILRSSLASSRAYVNEKAMRPRPNSGQQPGAPLSFRDWKASQ
jgi:hypothetical protein